MDLLARLTPPPVMAAWLRKAVVLGHQAKMEFQKAQEERIEADIATSRSRLERLSNCVWKDGSLEFELRSPFDLMQKARQNTPDDEPTLVYAGGQNEDWWRLADAYRTGKVGESQP